jgi:diguanylate cyclase (GGDEF)-like protein
MMLINMVDMLALAVIMPIIMGKQLSAAARYARDAMIVQAGIMLALLSANMVPNLAWHATFSSLSVFLMAWANWLGLKALEGWLGPRQGKRLLVAAMVVAPVGYLFFADNFHQRATWATGFLVLELLVVSWACLRPAPGMGGRWRWAMFGGSLAMAVASLARIGVMVFYPQDYPHFMAPHPVNLVATVVGNITLVVITMSTLVAWRHEAEALLEKQALTDALTGLSNRHSWALHGEPLFDAARRHGHGLTLLMLDLDHFKQVNDTRGHPEGDRVLRAFGSALQLHRRSSDVVARLGGEEFAVLLPQTDLEAARQIEQRLRDDWNGSCVEKLGYFVGFSAGLAVLKPSDGSLQALLGRADQALYRAKTTGRGRIEVHTEAMDDRLSQPAWPSSDQPTQQVTPATRGSAPHTATA